MTALNGLVQHNAVHLLTDGAIYRSDGRIHDIGSKIQAFPDARIAIGWAGFDPMKAIRRGVARRGARTGREILEALPAILRGAMLNQRRLFDLNQRIPILSRLYKSAPIAPELSVLVALWDEGPELWVIHSDDSWGAGLEPFKPRLLDRALELQPGSEAAVFGREVRFEDPASFDPARDGLALLEHQRRQTFPGDDGDHYCVGGIAELTTVSADGVRRRTLREWPDEIGRRIELADEERLAWAK